jgi:hypothetical protein
MADYSRGALGVAAVALCLVSTAAPASAASCWSQADVSAAKVHEMQTRLMVAATECHADGIDILASYNQFVAAKHAALSAADDRLRAHFLAAGGDAGERDYLRYTAALEQAYGAGATSDDSCAQAAAMVKEVTAAKADLVTVAAREVDTATLPSSVCPANAAVVLAAR